MDLLLDVNLTDEEAKNVGFGPGCVACHESKTAIGKNWNTIPCNHCGDMKKFDAWRNTLKTSAKYFNANKLRVD